MDSVERIPSAFVTDNDTGEKYELNFSRESVAFAERNGFRVNEFGDYPANQVADLFYYSFRMHNSRVSREKVDKLREKWGGLPEKLIKRLVALYAQAMTSNTMQSDEDAEKNSKVTLEM